VLAKPDLGLTITNTGTTVKISKFIKILLLNVINIPCLLDESGSLQCIFFQFCSSGNSPQVYLAEFENIQKYEKYKI
jgi:hypothetical protein